jgi:tetratricopeptide (TPR) repeat protein
MESSIDPLIKEIKEIKDEGNKAFAKNDYTLAKKKYSYIMQKIREIFPDGYNSALSPGVGAGARKILVDTLVIVYSNLSQVYINEKNYPTAMERVEAGLKLSPDNTKLLFKKGRILCELREFDKSQAILEDTTKKVKDEEEKRLFIIESERVKQCKKDYDLAQDKKLKGFLKGQSLFEEEKKEAKVKLAY